MARIWYDANIDLSSVGSETIGVIGYGIQGSAQACNMRDSGLNVIVGLRKDGESWAKAVKDGCKVAEVSDVAEKSDIIHILVPDMAQAKLYRDEVRPYLKEGQALSFSHGAAVYWKWIEPPKWVDVFMVAPKAPGQRMRELYLQGAGVPALVAVHQDHTGRAWRRILALAKATGCARAGLIETTFKEEVETDWFGEQVDLCGGVDMLIRTAFETLIENGYQPEVAYFECLHELKLIVDLIQKYGITGMYKRVSETARFGGLTRGKVVIGEATKAAMGKVLSDIKSGTFANEWLAVYEKEGTKSFGKYLTDLERHPIEQVGQKLRRMIWPGTTE